MRRRAMLALAATLAIAACHRAPVIEAHPALWRVRDADTTIWLLGTIHVLPDGVDWQTPPVRQAMNTADTLLMELPDDWAGTTRTFERMGAGASLPPIADRIAPASHPALAAALKAGGLETSAVDGKKSWAAAFIIAGAPGAQAGIGREHGVEAVLAARFAERHRPTGGLESATAQFALFDSLPETAQRVLLIRAIDDAARGSADYRTTLDAWAKGDVARMAATIDPAFRASPVLEEALASGRNRAWAAAIEARMARPGSVLVAVGAGHLVGPKSVIALLQARGYKIERVE
ncbi:MAG: TraB/GumN family protein [Sphingomonas sp.]